MNFTGHDLLITLICGSSEVKKDGSMDVKSALHFEIKNGFNKMPDTTYKTEAGDAQSSAYCEDVWNRNNKGAIIPDWDFLNPGDCVILSKFASSGVPSFIYVALVLSNNTSRCKYLVCTDPAIKKLFRRKPGK